MGDGCALKMDQTATCPRKQSGTTPEGGRVWEMDKTEREWEDRNRPEAEDGRAGEAGTRSTDKTESRSRGTRRDGAERYRSLKSTRVMEDRIVRVGEKPPNKRVGVEGNG